MFMGGGADPQKFSRRENGTTPGGGSDQKQQWKGYNHDFVWGNNSVTFSLNSHNLIDIHRQMYLINIYKYLNIFT